MKNRYLLLIIICMFMTGCSQERSKDENPVIAAQSKEENPVITVQSKEETVNNDNSEVTKYQDHTVGESGFYGDYQITACKGTAIACAMSPEEIDAAIGDVLSFQENTYGWNGNTMVTGYQEGTYSADQMFDDFGIQASELGIEKNGLLLVTVSTEGDFIGDYLYVLDENTLLIYYEGVFFEAKKLMRIQRIPLQLLTGNRKHREMELRSISCVIFSLCFQHMQSFSCLKTTHILLGPRIFNVQITCCVQHPVRIT